MPNYLYAMNLDTLGLAARCGNSFLFAQAAAARFLK